MVSVPDVGHRKSDREQEDQPPTCGHCREDGFQKEVSERHVAIFLSFAMHYVTKSLKNAIIRKLSKMW